MQGESLKNRLSSLKKASIELKSKVLNDPKINYDTINDIIATIIPNRDQEHTSVLTSGINHPQMTLTNSKILNNSSAVMNKQSNLHTHSHSSSFYLLPPSNPQSPQIAPLPSKSIADKFSIPERSSSGESLHSYSKDFIQRQIQRFRLQNDQIETQLIEINDQLKDLRKKELILEQESWKDHLPFMEVEHKAGIFITKLFIKEFDYDKIDYEECNIQVSHDKLILNLTLKPQRQFKLVDVVEVKYIGDNCMRVDFKSDETIFAFIQFNSKSDRQTFDLAFYVNHNISNSKDLDRSLFTQVREKEDTLTPHFTKAAKASKASLRPAEDAVGEDMLSVKNDRLRKNSSKLYDIKMSRSNVSNRSVASSAKKDDSFRMNGIEYTLNGNNEFENQFSPQAQEENQDKTFNEIMVFGSMGDSNHGSRANTSKFNQADVNFQNMELEKEDEVISPPLITSEKIEEQRQQLRWEAIIKELKGGYFFTKYSKGGVNPHNKKVFISNEENHLISMNTADANDRKIIPIFHIRSLQYPAIDDGIKKFLTTEVSENYCVLEYELNGNIKKMELGCHNPKFMQKFVEQLREFLQKKGVIIEEGNR